MTTKNSVVVLPYNGLYGIEERIPFNEKMAQLVNHFGLPGGRYSVKHYEDCTEVSFKSSKDALLCSCLFSEDI